MANTNEELILKNVQLRWAYLGKPSTGGQYPSNKYQVDCVINEEQMKALKKMKKDLGIPQSKSVLKELEGEDEGLYSICFKSPKQVIPKWLNKLPLSQEEMESIGNGTIAHVKVNSFQTKDWGAGIGLKAVVIKELHKYEGASAADDELFDDDGTVVDDDDSDMPFEADDKPAKAAKKVAKAVTVEDDDID